MHLGPNMKQVRELHGKTLQEVADRVGVSFSHLSEIEREKYPVTKELLKGWLRVFFMEDEALREFSLPGLLRGADLDRP